MLQFFVFDNLYFVSLLFMYLGLLYVLGLLYCYVFLVAPLAAARRDSSSHISLRDKKTSGGTQIDSSEVVMIHP